jgi:hypothetical protein
MILSATISIILKLARLSEPVFSYKNQVKENHAMRCLLASMIGLACLLVVCQTGCSNKGVELKMDKTIPFDSSRDKEGTPSGGGQKKGEPPMPKWTGTATEPGKPAPPK